MSMQKRRDTEAELRVRRRLHARGVRFRVDVKPEPDLRIKGGIVWRGLHVIVFIDGCFWHGCPEHATSPRMNSEWWKVKLENNFQRDRRSDTDLRSRGWTVLRFWEHEDSETVADTITACLASIRRSRREAAVSPDQLTKVRTDR